ncbi:MAG TPA: hypothetical protein VH139_00465, partial [Acidobacteriaceae bacterium]|nr:hypothetical protein [Acidobacteriaceae bacterium]
MKLLSVAALSAVLLVPFVANAKVSNFSPSAPFPHLGKSVVAFSPSAPFPHLGKSVVAFSPSAPFPHLGKSVVAFSP